MLADSDEQNEKVLLEKNFDGEKYFKPIRWSNSSEEIYFTEQRGGLGGYIIFGGPTNLSKINIYTNEVEYLSGEKGIILSTARNCAFYRQSHSTYLYTVRHLLV